MSPRVQGRLGKNIIYKAKQSRQTTNFFLEIELRTLNNEELPSAIRAGKSSSCEHPGEAESPTANCSFRKARCFSKKFILKAWGITAEPLVLRPALDDAHLGSDFGERWKQKWQREGRSSHQQGAKGAGKSITPWPSIKIHWVSTDDQSPLRSGT